MKRIFKAKEIKTNSFRSPVPSYNWTRRGTPLPRSAKSSSFNRVLTISNVQVEDQGEYLCRATNGRAAIENSVSLSIQGINALQVVMVTLQLQFKKIHINVLITRSIVFIISLVLVNKSINIIIIMYFYMYSRTKFHYSTYRQTHG